ncbi:MAG: TIGR00730 family Rossman fold protein [Flavobacteriaceae bacterium]|nr:TIGR00730 family Rossman fold protein [Flavobacteriaceae bacterium]
MDKNYASGWNELTTKNSWMLFKIMGEFVEGFEKMGLHNPCISIFGSARTPNTHPNYKLASEIAQRIVDLGFGVITGGGPGIMEAANKGAQEAGGASVGLTIDLPFEENHNNYIDKDRMINFDYFFVRKVMFVKYAQAFVVLPGGFGTLDELMEAITLIQTSKIKKIPIILVGTSFWNGLIDWLKQTLLAQNNTISEGDLDLFSCVDTADEVIDLLKQYYSDTDTGPNF